VSSTYVLHNADRLLGLSDKLVLSCLNLGPRFLAQVVFGNVLAGGLAGQCECGALCARLGGVQAQPRVLDVLAGTRGELDVGVQRRTPAGQEAALDLGVLCQARLADLLAGNGVLLERGGERVFAGACLLRGEHLRGVEGGAGHGMAERLGLGLCGGRRDEGSLGFGGRGGVGEEVDLLRDGAAEVGDGLADVGWVVVGFVGVLRAAGTVLEGGAGARGRRDSVRDLQHARVHLLQRIDPLLELNVVRRELRLLGGGLTLLMATACSGTGAPCPRPGQPAP
jgi:hypothetical protein